MEDATRPVGRKKLPPFVEPLVEKTIVIGEYVREFRTRPVYMVPGRGVVLALRAAEERREGFLGKLLTDDIKCGRVAWEAREGEE